MARRRSKQSKRRKRFTGINAVNFAEGAAQAFVLSNMAFNLDPVTFLLGDLSGSAKGTGYAYGANKVSLKELIKHFSDPHGGSSRYGSMTEAEIVWDNIKSNWGDALFKSVGIGVGFKVGKKLLRGPRRQANKMIRSLGMGDMVRV